MLRIRKVADATTAVNRSAIEAAQRIMRQQFKAIPEEDIAKLPDQFANPLKHKFVSRLFVAENERDQTLLQQRVRLPKLFVRKLVDRD